MIVAQYLQRLFSLDTLDPRFTTSSKAPPSNEYLLRDTSRSVRDDGGYDLHSCQDKRPIQVSNATKSRWRTPEFTVYAIVFLAAVPLMFKTAYDVSNRKYIIPLKS